MPDWNPAEIIGRRPSPLALSLYKELITDNIWAMQRRNYGFKNLENHQLLNSFYGMPYIDIRIDFNSWIPCDLDKKLSEKLVNFYLKKFKKNPQFHDKIEFEIVLTCFSFTLKQRINKLPNNIFSKIEKVKIFNSLKKINLKAYSELKEAPKKINLLKKKIKDISSSNLYPIDKIYWLLEDCKKFGTLTFASMARNGFIAIEFLNSMVDMSIINNKDKEDFLKSVNTIASEINIDLFKINKKKFIKKYGHIRPNTYDIDTKNYADGYKLYFNSKKNKEMILKKSKYYFSQEIKNKIKKHLIKNNHKVNVNELIFFIKESIRLREYSKFVFSKSIDEIFKNLKLIFRRINLSEKKIKYISIHTIKKLFNNVNYLDIIKILSSEVEISKKEYERNKFIKLPSNIYDENNIYFFSQIKNEPNFTTNKNITADIIILKELNKFKNYNNKIVCIENADPGYDFLFSHKIKGLITNYGGLNSQMAIRCTDTGVPSAIGVGDQIFEKILSAQAVQLNCMNKTIKTL